MATPPKTRRKAAVVPAVPTAEAAPTKKKVRTKTAEPVPVGQAAAKRATPRRNAAAVLAAPDVASTAKPAARKPAGAAETETEAKPVAKAKAKAKAKAETKSSASGAKKASNAVAEKPINKSSEKPGSKLAPKGEDLAAAPVKSAKSAAAKPAVKAPKARAVQAKTQGKQAASAGTPAERPTVAEPPVESGDAEAAVKPARQSTRSAAGKATAKGAKPKAASADKPQAAAAKSRRGRSAPVAPPVEPPTDVVELEAEVEGPYLLTADPGETLFGRFELQAREGGERVTLHLRGAVPGHYSCSCTRFLRSHDGRCEHSDFLFEQLQQGGEPIQALLQQGPQTAHSEVWLAYGAERRLIWRAGLAAPADLVAASRALLDADGAFSPEHGQILTRLIELAADAGHELRVDETVWPQVAAAADTLQRVLRLEAAFPGGPEDAALVSLLQQHLPAYQWEAALFAVCAGRALLADDLGLSHRTTTLAALRLWQQCFGVNEVLLLAPAERHALWQAEAQRLLGGWPAGVTLSTPEAVAAAPAAELLIVDAMQLAPALPDWPDAAPLLLLSDRELLGEPLLKELVERLDAQRRGPLARLLALGAQSAKRQQRDALQAVMLSRRRRELESQLPLTNEALVWLEAPVALDAVALVEARRLSQRWQQLAYLSQGEQLQLTRLLAHLRQSGSEAPALNAKAAALIDLLPHIVPAVADRVLVFAQQDACVAALGSALSALGLSVHTLLLAQSGAERAAALQGWRGEQGQILLATDGACAGLDLAQPGAALVHADLPWNPAEREQRVHRLASGLRGLPSWQLLQLHGLDAGLWAAQAGHDSLPAANLDQQTAQPFVGTGDLASFMATVARALAELPGA